MELGEELGKNLAGHIKQFQLDHALTTTELASELQLAVSTTQIYLNGKGNPRWPTLELLSKRMGIPVARLISPPDAELAPPSKPTPPPPQVKHVVRAARELAGLPPIKREKGIRLFLEMVELWSEVG